MKKMLIALAATAVLGMGTAMAEGYWGCVVDSVVTGADAAAEKAKDYGLTDAVTRNAAITGGALGGAAAGIVGCD